MNTFAIDRCPLQRPSLRLLVLVGVFGSLEGPHVIAQPLEATRAPVASSVASPPEGLHPQSKTKRRLVVQTLRASKGLEPLARDLTEEMVIRAGHLGGRDLVVLSEAEVELMLTHTEDVAELSPENCRRAEECLRRISEAADADQVLFGRLERLGDSYVAVLSLLDVKEAHVDRSESCAGPTKPELREALLFAVERVLNPRETQVFEAETVRPIVHSSSTIGVVPMTGLEDRPSVAATLTQILGLEIRRYEYSVQTQDELLTMIHYAVNRQELQKSGETLDEALIEIAGSMGVDYLATGTTGAFDDTIVIVLKLIDIHEAKVVRRVAESYRGPLAHLPIAMRFATAKLFGHPIVGQGDLSIVTEAEGHFRVDHRNKAPLIKEVTPVRSLQAAKHHLNLQAEGFYPYSIDVYIDPAGDQPLRLKPELVALPTPWYKSGLFWGITGTVVAGVTAAVLLTTLPPDGAHLASDPP